MSEPTTCLHRVLEPAEGMGGYIEYNCLSCGIPVDDEFFVGRIWKVVCNGQQLEQIGASPRDNRSTEVIARRIAAGCPSCGHAWTNGELAEDRPARGLRCQKCER